MTPLRRGTPAYPPLTCAMLFAGFSTFSLLYAVQPLLPLFAHDYALSAEGASLAVSLATGPLAIGIVFAGIQAAVGLVFLPYTLGSASSALFGSFADASDGGGCSGYRSRC